MAAASFSKLHDVTCKDLICINVLKSEIDLLRVANFAKANTRNAKK